MNTAELESILRRARPPEISGESLERFPRRVVASLKRDIAPRPAARGFFPRLAWAFGLAACFLVALAVGHWHGRMETKTLPSSDILASTKMVREMQALFPNRVRAIVEDARGLNLVLSDGDNVPDSTPLYVRICDGQRCSSFVTFSGQEIQVAGQNVTALSDARGGIILTGNQFVWSSAEGIDAGSHLKI
jgi:hypothetical protein